MANPMAMPLGVAKFCTVKSALGQSSLLYHVHPLMKSCFIGFVLFDMEIVD